VAAVRELKEETGYTGTVLNIFPQNTPIVLGPAVSNSTSKIAVIEIDGDTEENQHPVQHVESDEFIDVIKIPLSKLWEKLDDFQKQGIAIEGRLYTFALNSYLSNSQII